MKIEDAKNIDGYDGKYKVSMCGKVFSFHGEVKELKQGICSTGYPLVSLWINGKGRTVKVHRLVAKAFVDGDDELQVNHKNGIKTDNMASNLEWCTASENNLHRFKELGHTGSSLGVFGKDNCKSKAVIMTNAKGVSTIFSSIMDAVRDIGAHAGAVSGCCNGKIKSHMKCKWKFQEIRL
jgi:hypothetical protein